MKGNPISVPTPDGATVWARWIYSDHRERWELWFGCDCGLTTRDVVHVAEWLKANGIEPPPDPPKE